MAESEKCREWLTDEGLIKIEGWAKDGLTNKQIAKNVGVSSVTFYRWIKQNDKLNETLKRGKEVVDRQTENALLKRALGYEYEETTTMTSYDGKETTKTVKKHIPPDTTAIIFWLKNRKREQWRDLNKIEIDKPVHVKQNTNIDLSKLSKEEILKITHEAFSQD